MDSAFFKINFPDRIQDLIKARFFDPKGVVDKITNHVHIKGNAKFLF